MQDSRQAQRRELLRVHVRLATWGLVGCLLVVCLACKGHLLPMVDRDLLRYGFRLAMIAAGDLALVAGLAIVLLLTGRWASGRKGTWRAWLWTARTACAVVGSSFVIGAWGTLCLDRTPTWSFWAEACRGGSAAGQLAAALSPFLAAWLLVPLLGAFAAPWIARWFATLRRDAVRGGKLLACCLVMLLANAATSWCYLNRSPNAESLWYRDLAASAPWRAVWGATGD